MLRWVQIFKLLALPCTVVTEYMTIGYDYTALSLFSLLLVSGGVAFSTLSVSMGPLTATLPGIVAAFVNLASVTACMVVGYSLIHFPFDQWFPIVVLLLCHQLIDSLPAFVVASHQRALPSDVARWPDICRHSEAHQPKPCLFSRVWSVSSNRWLSQSASWTPPLC